MVSTTARCSAALLRRGEQRRLGASVDLGVAASGRRAGERVRRDDRAGASKQQLGARAEEAVDGERQAGRVQRPQAADKVGLAKRPVRPDRDLPGEHELGERAESDLRHGGGDPLQEVLVGPRRAELEGIGWRRRLATTGLFGIAERRGVACGEPCGEPGGAGGRGDDDRDRGLAEADDDGDLGHGEVGRGVAIERERPDRDRWLPRRVALAAGLVERWEPGNGGEQAKGAGRPGAVGEAAGERQQCRRPDPEQGERVVLEHPAGSPCHRRRRLRDLRRDEDRGGGEVGRVHRRGPSLPDVEDLVAVTHWATPPVSRWWRTPVYPASRRRAASCGALGR